MKKKKINRNAYVLTTVEPVKNNPVSNNSFEYNKESLRLMFQKLYGEETREDIELLIANLKSEIEELSGVDAFITARVKNPISIIKKFQTKPVYGEEWNKMKDLVGLMVVVESNNDVDDVIYHLSTNYAGHKNPNCKEFYKDYRIMNIRDDHNTATEGTKVYSQTYEKGYQTCDGYKNVRVNLMLNGYPIEIQIKTKEQYVAHEATHDPVYKSPEEKDENVRQEISDKLFPYFETYAHMMFHLDEMSDREIEVWKTDMQEIIERNGEFYNNHRKIFEDASTVFAFYMFMTNNMKSIYKDSVFGNSTLNLKLLEIEIKRIFHYYEKQIASNDPSMTSGEVFNATIDKIANLKYEQFLKIRDSLAGSYRCERCVISGVYDLLRSKDVLLFKRLSESFRKVDVGVYDDELAEIFAGKPPMFNLRERQAALRNLKGISSLYVIDEKGGMKSSESIEFLSLNPNEEKFIPVNIVPNNMNELLRIKRDKNAVSPMEKIKYKTYKIGYLPGVFDMLHPGHIEYISQVCKLCEKVYVGSKSDEYVRIIKKKEPVLKLDERKTILESIRGIEEVAVTEFDIIPLSSVLASMGEEIKKGNRCAIFMGSDWLDPEKTKAPTSYTEYENLTSTDTGIELVSIPRGNSKRSSTNYKGKGLERLNDQNPYEITIFD